MASGNFAACHAITAKWEGGWSNHPADPGGKTMYGITQATFNAWRRSRGKPTEQVRSITRGEAEEIYKANYWNAVRAEQLPAGVDLAGYDYAVNSGPSRSLKALGKSHRAEPVAHVKALCASRLAFVRALGTFKVFGKGWTRRIADIEARGVAMALGAIPAKKKADRLELEKKAAEGDARAAEKKAAGGSAVATGAGGASSLPSDADQWAAWALIGVSALAIGFVVWMVIRRKADRERADAYTAVAKEQKEQQA